MEVYYWYESAGVISVIVLAIIDRSNILKNIVLLILIMLSLLLMQVNFDLYSLYGIKRDFQNTLMQDYPKAQIYHYVLKDNYMQMYIKEEQKK
jgi:hypothetical protein